MNDQEDYGRCTTAAGTKPPAGQLTDQAARLAALLESDYRAHVASLHLVSEAGEKAIYRIDRHDGPSWVARLFPPSRPLARVQKDAAVLRYVEGHGVPAERLVLAASGAPHAILDGRGVLVTRYIDGTRPDRSPATLRRLGEAVGRLHALPPVPADDPLLGQRAGALPREDLAFGRACLARIAGRVPSSRLAEYQALRAALDATHDGEDLSQGLVHSDCHLANARLTPDGQVVFFDWVGSGQGPRLAALGLLLYSCAVAAPDDPPVPPGPLDLRRVDAVMVGYGRHHRLPPAELARLPDMVRVRPAVIAARSLAAQVEQGALTEPAGWWTRYAEAEAVAARASRTMLHGSQPS